MQIQIEIMRGGGQYSAEVAANLRIAWEEQIVGIEK